VADFSGIFNRILLTGARAHRDASLSHDEELVDDFGEAVDLISGVLKGLEGEDGSVM
jgi:hypothetical protein